MSSTAPTKRARPTNVLPSGRGVIDWLKPFFTTTVGSKVVVALTGLAVFGFVVGHLVGNLKVFNGQDDINGYAQFLKDLGPLLWVARGGLLARLRVARRACAAVEEEVGRGPAGAVPLPDTVQAGWASRNM